MYLQKGGIIAFLQLPYSGPLWSEALQVLVLVQGRSNLVQSFRDPCTSGRYRCCKMAFRANNNDLLTTVDRKVHVFGLVIRMRQEALRWLFACPGTVLRLLLLVSTTSLLFQVIIVLCNGSCLSCLIVVSLYYPDPVLPGTCRSHLLSLIFTPSRTIPWSEASSSHTMLRSIL